MSAPQPTAHNEIPSEQSEFTDLLRLLDEAEYKYKIGDVDDRVDEGSNTRWTFELELNEIDKLVKKHRERLLAEYPTWYYKFIAIQAEAKEYYDTATSTYHHDLFLLAQQLYRDLPKRVALGNSPADEEERKRLKNVIRVIIAGFDYLHTIGDLGAALTYGHGLLDFVVNRGLATNENPAHATRALIYYFLGRTLRQRGIDDDYQQAIDYFYQCNEAYFEMAQRRGNQHVDVVYARTRAMVSLAFGAGFLFYTAQSDLARAKALIAQARHAFLKDDGKLCCQLHYHYLELLYASILRAEAGDMETPSADDGPQLDSESAAREEKLHRAGEILDRCAKEFHNNRRYYVHVLLNKALLYIYKGSEYYDQAREHILELIRLSQDSARWQSNGYIIKSHLELRSGDFDTALADALTAYNLAGNHLPLRVEALLTRGQAQLRRGYASAARMDFEKALQLNNGANLKFAALADLLLVETALEQQQPKQAFERFKQLGGLMSSIRHGFLINKYRRLEARLKEFQTDFFIAGDTEELDYKRLEGNLQHWILSKALREDNNLTRVAQRLQVSKKTVYMWLEKHRIKN